MRRLGVLTAVALVAAMATTPQNARARQSDVSLADAVRLAIDHHPSLRLAGSERSAAVSRVGVAQARRLPSVTASGAVTRFQEPMIVAPLHAFDPSAPPIFDRTLVQSRWMVDYTVYDGGARGATIAGARELASAAAADRDEREQALIVQVVRVYLAVLSALTADSAQAALIAALEQEQRRIELLAGEGRAAQVDALRVLAALGEAEAARVATTNRVSITVDELARLTGRSIEAGRLRSAPPTPANRRTAPDADALDDHPRLRSARRHRAAAEAQYRASQSTRFPTVRLSAGLVTFGSAAGDFTGEWQGGIAISYPLFLRDRSPRIRESRAGMEASRERVRLIEMDVERQVTRQRAATEEVTATAAAYRRVTDHLAEVARIERLSLEAGIGVQSEYLRAEARLAEARARLASLEHEQTLSLVRLAEASGTLTLEWLEQLLEDSP